MSAAGAFGQDAPVGPKVYIIEGDLDKYPSLASTALPS